MAPMVHGLEAKYFGKIKFSYLDADDSRTKGFQKVLGFYYQPELYLLDGNGQLLHKFVGYQDQAALESVFAQFLP